MVGENVSVGIPTNELGKYSGGCTTRCIVDGRPDKRRRRFCFGQLSAIQLLLK